MVSNYTIDFSFATNEFVSQSPKHLSEKYSLFFCKTSTIISIERKLCIAECMGYTDTTFII